jgi:glutamine synthetase
MNTIFAESIDYVAAEIEKAMGGDSSKLHSAIQDVLKEIIEKHGDVIFNGDGYTEEWQQEAAKRGLPNMKTTPEALPVLVEDATIELFEKYNVLSKAELHSRFEIYAEQYVKKIAVEGKTAIEMAETIIYPAAIRFQTLLADNCIKLKELGLFYDESVLKETIDITKSLKATTESLKKLMGHSEGDTITEAEYCCKSIIPEMLKLRESVDKLETIIADDMWALPTYQEMLFIK